MTQEDFVVIIMAASVTKSTGEEFCVQDLSLMLFFFYCHALISVPQIEWRVSFFPAAGSLHPIDFYAHTLQIIVNCEKSRVPF